MKTFLTSALAVFAFGTLIAQEAPEQAKFEVISVKRTERCEFKTSIDLLKDLLTERFKLAAHRENRLRPGYVLLLDKGLSKLKETTSTSTFLGAQTGGFMFGAGPNYTAIKGSMTIQSLAFRLSVQLKTPVEDLTGLKEKYDIDIAWLPDPSAPPPAPSNSDGDSTARSPLTASMPTTDVIAAIRNSLGLRLEPRKREVGVIVIDHIERFPREN